MKNLLQRLSLFALLAGLSATAPAAQTVDVVRPDWPESLVEKAASLPVQDGGRIKPLQTYASFQLLPINGKRKVDFDDGETMSPMEWYLTTVFFPDYADDYEVFQVRDSAVMDAIGLGHAGKKKADRYSFNEIRPGIQRLFELWDQYGRIDEKERSSVQHQIVLLASNVSRYFDLRSSMEFARYEHEVGHTPEVQQHEKIREIFPDPTKVRFHDILANLGTIVDAHNELRASGETEVADELSHVYQAASEAAAPTRRVAAMLPPLESREEEAAWHTPGDLSELALMPGYELPAEYSAAFESFERLAAAKSDFGAFERELDVLHANLVGLAEARGEYGKIPLELNYYNKKWVANSQVLFILSFLLTALMWIFPRGKALYRGTMVSVVAAMSCLIVAIVLRCIIRGRPPVSTLYETILFVTAGWALVAVIVEVINKRRIMISAGAFLGCSGCSSRTSSSSPTSRTPCRASSRSSTRTSGWRRTSPRSPSGTRPASWPR